MFNVLIYIHSTYDFGHLSLFSFILIIASSWYVLYGLFAFWLLLIAVFHGVWQLAHLYLRFIAVNCSILWCAAISAFIFYVGIHNILHSGVCEMYLNVSCLCMQCHNLCHHTSVTSVTVYCFPAVYGMSLIVSSLHWTNLASLLQLLTLTYLGSCTVSADDALELLLLGYIHIPSYGCAFHG